MPNWVTNELVVTGDTAQLKDFKSKFFTKVDGKKHPTFSVIVSMPIEEKDNWYDWNCNNWGTKWEPTHYEKNQVTAEIVDIQFDTAWSPPIEFFNTCADIYDKLRFKCYFIDEMGNFCGMFDVKGDEHTIEYGDVAYEDANEKQIMFVDGEPRYVETNSPIDTDKVSIFDYNPFKKLYNV
jgi:hypothetical protein